MSITKKEFGRDKDGKEVSLYTIENGKYKAEITDYGANVVSLFVPDDKGEVKDIVHGFDRLEDYFDNPCFFGACIGRNANRIANARFTLDGKEYSLAVNDNENNLHTDADNGFHKKLWKAEIKDAENRLELSYRSPDMENGFPGNMDVRVSYSLSADGEFKIEYEALSDKKTVFNPTNHSYFNLAGHDSAPDSVYDTVLQINASHYTPVVAGAIPTGEVAAVAGTVFDFTKPKRIGDEIDADIEQLKLVGGYDHNFAVDGYDKTVKEVAKACAAGRVMTVLSDLPGIQFYAGNMISPLTGKGGVKYAKRSAFCLETQFYPNSINQDGFEKPVIEANKPFKTVTIYKFG
ncbi:MAG TPA: galactose-1-epimerase [Lachnospiraceae bacterium]|nr:galactose-1-epimerase [Lachnospiraceae bacterium]